MGTIVSMRRVVLVVVLALVVGGVAWALWPATKWPQSFCAPVTRVVGTDAIAMMNVDQHYGWQRPVASDPGGPAKVATLRADVLLAKSKAPTSQLRAELSTYASHVRSGDSMLTVTDALNIFDSRVHRQLEACGIKPIGSGP